MKSNPHDEHLASIIKETMLGVFVSPAGQDAIKIAALEALRSDDGQRAIVSAMGSDDGQKAIVGALRSRVGKGALAEALRSEEVKESLMETFIEGFGEVLHPVLDHHEQRITRLESGRKVV